MNSIHNFSLIVQKNQKQTSTTAYQIKDKELIIGFILTIFSKQTVTIWWTQSYRTLSFVVRFSLRFFVSFICLCPPSYPLACRRSDSLSAPAGPAMLWMTSIAGTLAGQLFQRAELLSANNFKPISVSSSFSQYLCPCTCFSAIVGPGTVAWPKVLCMLASDVQNYLCNARKKISGYSGSAQARLCSTESHRCLRVSQASVCPVILTKEGNQK